jgi:hypothetical protein
MCPFLEEYCPHNFPDVDTVPEVLCESPFEQKTSTAVPLKHSPFLQTCDNTEHTPSSTMKMNTNETKSGCVSFLATLLHIN